LLNKIDDELLSLDLGDLDVSVRVSVEQQLVGYLIGQEVEESLRRLAKLIVNNAFELIAI